MIQAYKNIDNDEVEEQPKAPAEVIASVSDVGISAPSVSPTGVSSNNSEPVGVTGPYVPPVPWKPSKTQNVTLCFAASDGQAFQLSDTDDEDVKIKMIIRELSGLWVTTHPYACTLLYRTLLEASTRKAFIEKKPVANGQVQTYSDSDLPGSIVKLCSCSKLMLSDSDRGAIKSCFKQQHLLRVLNDFIHNPKLVDTNFILNSWITMKEYVKACLT